MSGAHLQAFIDKWRASGASERANAQLFLAELCDVLGVDRPDPATGNPERDRYVFEKVIKAVDDSGAQSVGFADLYRAGCFVLEAKQGSEVGTKRRGSARRRHAEWHIAMRGAFGQALGYARALDEPPPFILTCDVGHCFELYASFDSNAVYRPYPSPLLNRIMLDRLGDHVDVLRSIWDDPFSLDPARVATAVTMEVASRLATLAATLERAGHDPEVVAKFLMRCIFTMFAEDVGLLPEPIFTQGLQRWLEHPETFKEAVEGLWRAMNAGETFGVLGRLLRFNGGLFLDSEALTLGRNELGLLHEAAKCDWRDVEPAIFGTLLERALNREERAKLGAHFTPRSYVERLVHHTIEVPLREEWDGVQAEVSRLVDRGSVDKAEGVARAFHQSLCETRVLDPACGSGNFLYVALDLFMRLEGEVRELLAGLKQGQLDLGGREVTPEQFRGLEVKPWAKEIADLVLWIGYLQHRTRVSEARANLPEPVLNDYGNVECRDALVAPSHGAAREASWPDAAFVVGNPPFIGNKRMRAALGDEYVDTLRALDADVPNSADFVMHWWQRAARLVATDRCIRFGLITTSSVTQGYNRAVLAKHIAESGLRLAFAIPDHPWVDADGSADVRIAMTVADKSVADADGELWTVEQERAPGGQAELQFRVERGAIHPDLTLDVNTGDLRTLRANDGLSFMGVTLCGQGFVVPQGDYVATIESPHLKPYIIGRDINGRTEVKHVIDFYGLSAKSARAEAPELYQRVLAEVKPERDQQRRKAYRDKWWIFAEARQSMRAALEGLPRFIATCRTSTHRVFTFVPAGTLVESTVVAIALDDAFSLGVLSSRLHVTWATRVGTRLGVGNDPRYNNTRCFLTFPFPTCDATVRNRIEEAAEALDRHRVRQLELRSDLTITMLYNVLSAVRVGAELTETERKVYDDGLVELLRELHDELDAAVADAYGVAVDIEEREILHHLAALNAERAEKESEGTVRWLRPEYQKHGRSRRTKKVPLRPLASGKSREWPRELPRQIVAVRQALRFDAWTTADAVAATFEGSDIETVEIALKSLAELGLAVSANGREPRRWRGTDVLAAGRSLPTDPGLRERDVG